MQWLKYPGVNDRNKNKKYFFILLSLRYQIGKNRIITNSKAESLSQFRFSVLTLSLACE